MVPDGFPGQPDGRQQHSASANGGSSVRTRGRGSVRAFEATISYGTRDTGDRWEAHPVSYEFKALDSHGAEVLAYHLHPWMLESDFPHIHVQTVDPDSPLAGVHLPTGMVTFGEFVGLLIRDLGVAPLRADWREVLGL
jgi:hypothetical protein